MTGMLDGWVDITNTIAANRRAANVSIAWRRPKKGRPMLEFLINNKLAAQLGWTGAICAGILVAPDRSAIAFLPRDDGKALRDRSGGLAVTQRAEWIDAALPAQPAEIAPHRIEGTALVVTLPAWAREDAPAETPAPAADPTPTAAPRRGGAQPSKLTPEREATFRRLWMDPTVTVRQVLDAVNALPGETYATPQSMYSLAVRLDLPAERRAVVAVEARPAAPPPADGQAEDEREAAALVRGNPERWHGRAIAEEYGWDIQRAAAFVQRVRAGMAAERKGAAA